jgi:hypothetical protein
MAAASQAASPPAAPEPVAAAPVAREPLAAEPVAVAVAVPPPPPAGLPAREAIARQRLNRRTAAAQSVAGAAADITSAKPVAAPLAAPPAPAAAPPVAVPAPEAARGPREILAEADKLLAQGEIADACARGEEAKHLGPKLPAVYKFLGKCYMRAGKTSDGNDNYRHYLELAPGAPDAPFVKSMIK